MDLVAYGATGFGDLICETESGRPFGTSAWDERDSLLEECLSFEEECLDELVFLSEDDLELVFEETLVEDFSDGTSRMFKARPVVGSVVESSLGLWATWYPSMM